MQRHTPRFRQFLEAVGSDRIDNLQDVKESGAGYVFINSTHDCYADVFFVAKGVVAVFMVRDDGGEYDRDHLNQELSLLGLLPGRTPLPDAVDTTQLLCDAAGIGRSDVVFTKVRRGGLKKEKNGGSVRAVTPFIHVRGPSTTTKLLSPFKWPPAREDITSPAISLPSHTAFFDSIR